MSSEQRILWGAVGAIAAVLTSLISLDITVMEQKLHSFTLITWLLYAAKYTASLLIGALLAYLKEGEQDRTNLLVLGASAPTILITLFNAQQVIPK